MSNNLYVDFHVLQTVPPSCVNRDDTGSPKTAVLGGKTRARVSSQAWKHAMREEFRSIFSAEQIGYRTKKVKELLVQGVIARGESISSEKAEEMVEAALKILEFKADEGKKDVLFFISAKQINVLADAIIELNDDKDMKEKEKKERYKEALKKNPSIDIALFGRMAASDPSLNYDAAAQVAHSISTHAVSNEYDYFTAVDDCMEEDNAGAGHLGTVEFNSATLYRYATVNVMELTEHLGTEEAKVAVKGFAEAFIKAMPTGKQNTFANRTLPDMVYVTVRTDQPVNLVNAFEKPVVAGENGFVEKSKNIFGEYVQDTYSQWVSEPVKAWHIGKNCITLGEEVTYPQLMEAIELHLNTVL